MLTGYENSRLHDKVTPAGQIAVPPEIAKQLPPGGLNAGNPLVDSPDEAWKLSGDGNSRQRTLRTTLSTNPWSMALHCGEVALSRIGFHQSCGAWER